MGRRREQRHAEDLQFFVPAKGSSVRLQTLIGPKWVEGLGAQGYFSPRPHHPLHLVKRLSAHALSILSFSALSIAGLGSREDPTGGAGGRRVGFSERIKASLKVTDAEWAVLQPLVENVLKLQRAAMGIRVGGGSAAAGGIISWEKAHPGALAGGDSCREAEAKLAAAGEELRRVLTPKQEAYFISRGMLD